MRLAVLALLAALAVVTISEAPPAAAAARRTAAKPRKVGTKAHCARRSPAVRRKCLATARGRLVGVAHDAVIWVPGAFAAPGPFEAAPAGALPPTVPAPTPTPDAPVLPPVYSNPYAVQVQGFEFGLQLSKAAVSAGDVRVEFNLGRAEDPHNLWLVREDGTGSPYSFDEQPSGAVAAKTLALSGGRWKLFCSLSGHEAAGMRATLTVG